jgi:membrane fusion protein (multidrug efflux system)
VSGPVQRVLEAVVGAVVIGLAVVWLSGGCGERVPPGEVGSVQHGETGAVAVVEQRVGPDFEWASGAVESARRTAVASRILARIDEIRVNAGSEVAEGDLLIRLDARDLAARSGEAEEALRGARARLALARTEQERAAKLAAQGVESQQRLDRAESALRVARAEVDRLEASQSASRTGVSFAEIRSPVSGRVVDRLAEPGDTAVPGRPLLRIYDPSVLRVEVPVRESLAVRLTVGDPLGIRIPSLNEKFEAAINEIVPFAEPGARTLLVKARLPYDARLYAGMFARAAVPAGERTRLVVPERTVERIGQLEFVTVIGESGPQRRMVTTGPRLEEDLIEVLSGLAAGERVALPPSS